MMTKEQRRAKLAALLQVPDQVKMAMGISFILGLVLLARIVMHAHLKHLPLGPSSFVGGIFFFLFWIGGVSLLGRFKLGFVVLIVLALFPVHALLLLTDRFLELLVEDAFGNDWPLTIHYTAGFVQLVLTGLLFYFLFSKPVLYHVWMPVPVKTLEQPPIRESP